MNKIQSLVLGLVVIASFSVATGLVVHHNDQASKNHAMMMAESDKQKAVDKAMTDAAMKQEEKDKMAAHDAMMAEPSNTKTQ